MPIFAETEAKIFGDILYDVLGDTNITRVSPGSKTRAISQALSRKLGRMWGQFDLNMVQAFITGAEGRYLDLIGGLLGLNRLGEQPSSVASSDKTIKFYVDSGTFGNINSGMSIYIPRGTIISTAAYGAGIQYQTTNAMILVSDSDTAFISAQAIISGTRSNVGANQLIYHTFNNYTDSIRNTLKVTNSVDIISGANRENDTNFRFRIVNAIVGSEAANRTAIRVATLNVPGVADLILLPFYHGIGSYDLLIKATTPTVPDSLLEMVDEAVGKVTAQGIFYEVRRPIETGVSMEISLILRRQASETEKSSLIDAVTLNVINYINNLDIAEELIINEIVERVMSTSDLIKNMGTSSKPIDKIFLHKPSMTEDNKIRSQLLVDYTPASDEKLFVEDRYAGLTPINIKVTL